MADQRIGGGYVEILTKGLTQVQRDFDDLKKKLTQATGAGDKLNTTTGALSGIAKTASAAFEQLGGTIQRAGSIATKAFLGATAGVTALVRSADPYRFAVFAGNLGALSVQIGSIFLPLIDKANHYLQTLLGWFRNLSNQQKDHILRWAEIGAVIVGTIALVPRIVGGIRAIMGVLALFGVEVGVATGGLSVVLGLVAAAVPAVLGLGAAFGVAKDEGGILGKLFSGLKPVFDGFKQLAASVEKALYAIALQAKPLIDILGGALGRAFSTVGGVLSKVLGAAVQVVGGFATHVFGALQSIWNTVGPPILSFLDRLGKLWMQTFSRMLPFVQRFAEAVGQVFDTIGEVFAQNKEAFASIFDSLGQIVEELANAFAPLQETALGVITELVKAAVPLLRVLGDAFGAAVKGIAVGVKWVAAVVHEAAGFFTPLTDAVKQVAEAIASLFIPVVELLTLPLQVVISLLSDLFGGMDGLTAAIKAVAEGLRLTLVPIVHMLRDALLGIIDFVYNAIDKLIEQVNRIIAVARNIPGLSHLRFLDRPQRVHFGMPEERQEGKGGGFDVPEPEKGDHSIKYAHPVEITGLTDAWRKAQQAVNVNDPAKIKERERDEVNKKQLAELEKANKHLEDLNKKDGGLAA